MSVLLVYLSEDGLMFKSTARWLMQLQYVATTENIVSVIVQELCESRGGRPELSVLTSLRVSVDVKNY